MILEEQLAILKRTVVRFYCDGVLVQGPEGTARSALALGVEESGVVWARSTKPDSVGDAVESVYNSNSDVTLVAGVRLRVMHKSVPQLGRIARITIEVETVPPARPECLTVDDGECACGCSAMAPCGLEDCPHEYASRGEGWR